MSNSFIVGVASTWSEWWTYEGISGENFKLLSDCYPGFTCSSRIQQINGSVPWQNLLLKVSLATRFRNRFSPIAGLFQNQFFPRRL